MRGSSAVSMVHTSTSAVISSVTGSTSRSPEAPSTLMDRPALSSASAVGQVVAPSAMGTPALSRRMPRAMPRPLRDEPSLAAAQAAP